MKKRISGFIAGVLVTILVSTLVIPTLAAHIEATFNSVNITLNGKQIAKAGESYTLNDGTTTPYSIVYNNTTYLPMRKIAEMLELNVDWDGESRTVTLREENIAPEENPITYEEFKGMWNVALLSAYDEYNSYTGKYNGDMTEDELRDFLWSIKRKALETYMRDMAIEAFQSSSENLSKDSLSLSLTCRISDPPLDVSKARINIDKNYNITFFRVS